MKFHGRKISEQNIEWVILPRPPYFETDSEGNTVEKSGDLVFKVLPILDHEKFEQLCPRPQPPKILRRGGTVENVEDPGYKSELQTYGERRLQWMILESLRETPGLEWETVVISDPATWGNFEQEMKDSGLLQIEIGKIISAVLTVNALDDTKLEEARKRFLASQQPAGA